MGSYPNYDDYEDYGYDDYWYEDNHDLDDDWHIPHELKEFHKLFHNLPDMREVSNGGT